MTGEDESADGDDGQERSCDVESGFGVFDGVRDEHHDQHEGMPARAIGSANDHGHVA